MPPVELPDQLRCLYTTELKEENGSYVIKVPNRELQQGDLQRGEMYKVALLPALPSEKEPNQKQEAPKPPVQEGDVRTVEVEAIGTQGDGIAKIERGYVIIIPETEVGDKVTTEITNVAENFALGEVTSGRSEAGQGPGE
jgi:predicted RNA-binding protein with TRAM domain